MKNRKGFTLIELLVVIAIIGLLSTLAVVSLNSARQKTRDARRITDIKQIQTALELYLNDQSGYPEASSAIVLGSDSYNCLGTTGFSDSCGSDAYMSLVPKNQQPGGVDYSYTSDGTVYAITFQFEGARVGDLVGSYCTASNGGKTVCTVTAP